jgi:hypothetical protein
MSFLTSVVKNGRHKEMFSSKEVLSQLCEKIVLPNMGLRGTLQFYIFARRERVQVIRFEASIVVNSLLISRLHETF